MTGFFTIVRGFSFRKESRMAFLRILVSIKTFDFVCEERSMCFSKSLAGKHQQMLQDGAQAQRGEKSERANDQHGADQKNREEWPGHGESAE
jgi:hypothetical protein